MWKTLLSMASFDVDSLFNNIPLVKTINKCVNRLFENTDSAEGFDLKELLRLSTNQSYFLFNSLHYKETDGVAMGNLLNLPLLAHFFHTMKKTCLISCPQGFKPSFYQCYVDNISVLFKLIDHLKYFHEVLSCCHINMSFSVETERQNEKVQRPF